jgi:hypothetical protein
LQRRKDVGVYRNERGIVGGAIGYSEARTEAWGVISEARHGRDPFIGEALLRNAEISTFEGLSQRFVADPAPGRRGRVLSEATRTGITRGSFTGSSYRPGTAGPELDPAVGQGYRRREAPQEACTVPRDPGCRLHGDGLFVGGAARDPPLHALPRAGEALRRAAEDAPLRQRRDSSPVRSAHQGAQADRRRAAHALLYSDHPPSLFDEWTTETGERSGGISLQRTPARSVGIPIQRVPPAIGRTTTGIRASDTTC